MQKENKQPDRIVLDEANEYRHKYLMIAAKIFDGTIFLLGDFGSDGKIYQLPPIIKRGEKGKSLSTFVKNLANKIFLTKNYRITDHKLLLLLQRLRDGAITKQEIVDIIGKNKGSYTINDYILTSKKNKIKKITQRFKHLGNKWLIRRNSKKYCNGDVLIQKNRPPSGELRHAFTYHQIEGETIESNVFIDMEDMFDRNMLYVGLSRVHTLKQLFIYI